MVFYIKELIIDTKLLSVKAAANFLGMSVSTIYRLLKNDPNFPKALKITRKKTVFRSEDLNAWVKALKSFGINSKTRN